jgi:hypothetical protein
MLSNFFVTESDWIIIYYEVANIDIYLVLKFNCYSTNQLYSYVVPKSKEINHVPHICTTRLKWYDLYS